MLPTHLPERQIMEKPNEGQDYHDLISTLPLELGGLRKYQGVWMLEKLLPETMKAQRQFKARPTDILLASYPKCGTTWLKALAFATITRTRHSAACHPLHGLNPHECMPCLESERLHLKTLSDIDAVSGPRLRATHLPFHMLPESIKTSGCRLVYICRDPKDAVVSRWHFKGEMGINTAEPEAVRLRRMLEMLEMYCDGICPYGSIWDHVLGYWNESLRAPERVLFLKYEEMLESPIANLTRLAEFMGCHFTEEEVTQGVPAEITSLCSFHNLRDLAIKQNRSVRGDYVVPTEAFYRKGVAGDWKNHLSPEMAGMLDRITQEKLQGTGLALGRPSSETTTMDA